MLAYTLGDESSSEVWIRDLAGSKAPVQLTNFNGTYHSHTIALSPDGKTVALERVKFLADLYQLENF